jgi:hypothetical protein
LEPLPLEQEEHALQSAIRRQGSRFLSMNTKDRFEQYEWHDAELLKLSIDRRDPGNTDEVEMSVRFDEEAPVRFLFEDCYRFEASLNFGIIATESVYDVLCTSDSEILNTVKQKFKKMDIILEPLYHFEITTNSTNGKIVIVAKSFTVIPE